MSDLDSSENVQPSPASSTEAEPQGAPLPALIAPSTVTEVPLPREGIQNSAPLSTPGHVTIQNVREDGFSRMLSRESDKVRQLITDAGAVAPTVTEFVDFEKAARDWENARRRSGSAAEALLENAIDKAAVAYRRLRDSGAVRANSVCDELLSNEQRREQRRVTTIEVQAALYGSGKPLLPPDDLTLDKLLALPVHAAAQVFPMLEGSALEQLTEDIRLSGCRQPISVALIDGELTLLDGRNRLVSCGELGIMPPIRIYEGEDPVSFIRSQNIRRRHLKPSVRASIAHELLPEIKAEAKRRMVAGKGDPEVTCTQGKKRRAPQARDVAAEHAGVSGTSVQRRETLEAKGTTSLKAAVAADQIPAHLAAKAAVLPDFLQDALVEQVLEGANSPKQIKTMIDAAKGTPGTIPSKPRRAKAPAAQTRRVNARAWDLTTSLIPSENGLRAQGVLEGSTYEFLIHDLSLRVRKIGRVSGDGDCGAATASTKSRQT